MSLFFTFSYNRKIDVVPAAAIKSREMKQSNGKDGSKLAFIGEPASLHAGV